MTLNDFLSDISDDTVVYIGAEHSFLFCGTVSEFYEDIELLNTHWKHILLGRAERAEAWYIYTLEEKEQLIADDERMKQQDFIIEKALAHLKGCRSRYENFKPFQEREVLDSYQKTYEEGTAILIKGGEAGLFWLRSEYQKWIRKRKSVKMLA